ncbi:hypothetical protein [Streptomyces inhibens]|uniref:hypothetical protein n=1 Tax=Streptomyces inhibens TaxID=2293571 RepID=UPI001EE752CC|nr:hypothetical protein [Streptomyces inhibens]UKY54552.1 hypothetical protein KI385_40940 [Streptomyces inhibens]
MQQRPSLQFEPGGHSASQGVGQCDAGLVVLLGKVVIKLLGVGFPQTLDRNLTDLTPGDGVLLQIP